MIRGLRRKLITACMISLTIVLAVILGGVNLMGYHKVVSDADAVLTLLADNDGAFPQQEAPFGRPGGGSAPFSPLMSPETPYESRFFSVELDETGQVIRTDIRQVAAVDEVTATAYGQRVFASRTGSGFQDDYRYLRTTGDGTIQVLFLDCSRGLSSVRMTLLTSLALAAAGLGAVLVLLLVLSSRIVRPVAESYKKQKQFITDAGHELKTPMTIIGADVELAEMECGENQWLSDIRRQTQRLTALTNDLIYLSRMDEEQPALQLIEFPISDLVEEMAGSFLAPVTSQGKTLVTHIQPMLSFTGDEKAIRQLLSILLDNALKYSPVGGNLALSLERQGRSLILTMTNTMLQPIEPQQLHQLFERFYRADQSRNSETGGYGLGLAIARSIVLAHKGKIWAESPDGHSIAITVRFSL